MDPALLKEHQAFLKRAKSNPVVEKRKLEEKSAVPAKKFASIVPEIKSKVGVTGFETFNYKTAQASGQQRFAVLAKIVKHMKERHKQGDTFPLALDEILEEINQSDISPKIQQWLSSEALKNNPKIEEIDGKYTFKPVFNIRDRRGLLKLLKNNDLKGLGGVLLDDVEESVPSVHKVLKLLGESVLYVTRPKDKKKILFYNDRELQFTIDEEFKALWRSVSVEGVDERKIEEYLERQGINSMQDLSSNKVINPPKRKKPNRRKPKNFKSQNEHLEGILQDYSETSFGEAKT